jgi:hypothetical protein
MAHYSTTITTPLPIHHAFSYVSRFDRTVEWDPGIAAATMLTDEPVRPGSRFALEARFLGRSVPLVYEIVELRPDTLVVLRAENAYVRSVDTISFDTVMSAGGTTATTVTYDARLEPKGAMKLAAPLLAVAFRRVGDRAADGLRRQLTAVHDT